MSAPQPPGQIQQLPAQHSQWIEFAMQNGPTRVLISDGFGCEAVHPRRATKFQVAVIFIRDDGWSLGAPTHLEHEAKALWDGHWIAVLRRPVGWVLEVAP